MSRDMIRLAIVGSILVALCLIALLVSTSPALSSIAGAHHAHTGIQLIAPAYQHQHNIA
jgi:hypothetical protein